MSDGIVPQVGWNLRERLAPRDKGTRETFGLVYFLQAPEVGRIKIGHTDIDNGRRIGNLRTANAALVHPIAYARGTLKVECVIHDLFDAHRLHGEWFDFVPEIEEFVGVFATAWPDRRHPDSIAVPSAVARQVVARTLRALDRWNERVPPRGPSPRIDWSAGLPGAKRWEAAILYALDDRWCWTEVDARRVELDAIGRDFAAKAMIEAAKMARCGRRPQVPTLFDLHRLTTTPNPEPNPNP